MPLTFTRNFRVRYYECDAFGHMNNTHYLRYMQETAFDASAAAGYDLPRYERMGHSWLIRASEIEYLRPLQYNDPVAVKTWVADFHHTTSRRMYEFRLEGTGEIVARAHTDWIFVETETHRPVRIPDELKTTFFPDGEPATMARQPLPKPPPPPPGVFRSRRRVVWRDLDMVQHVNNAVYLDYVDDCGFQVIAAHHWPVQRMQAERLAILIRQHRIVYHQAARMDDELEVATWASQVKRSTATRYYTIHRIADGELLVEVQSLGVWVDLDSGRPMRIPARFLEDFATNIV